MERVLPDVDAKNGNVTLGLLRMGALLKGASSSLHRWRGRDTAGPSH
jgi:hypothetical protein